MQFIYYYLLFLAIIDIGKDKNMQESVIRGGSAVSARDYVLRARGDGGNDSASDSDDFERSLDISASDSDKNDVFMVNM
jgi:hypothetical protein